MKTIAAALAVLTTISLAVPARAGERLPAIPPLPAIEPLPPITSPGIDYDTFLDETLVDDAEQQKLAERIVNRQRAVSRLRHIAQVSVYSGIGLVGVTMVGATLGL